MLHYYVRRGQTYRSFLYTGRRASCNSPVNSTVGCTLDINSVTTVVGSCTVHLTVYMRITHHHVTPTVYHKLIALHFANGFVAAAGGHLKIYKAAEVFAQGEKQKKQTRVLFVVVQHFVTTCQVDGVANDELPFLCLDGHGLCATTVEDRS